MQFNDHTKDNVSPLVLWGHWFTFINMLLAMLIATRFLYIQGWPDTLLAQAYMLVNLVGHFAFLGFAGYLFTLFPITVLLPFSHILRGVGALVATIGLTILAFDAEIFDHYRLHLNPFVLDIASADIGALLDNPIVAVFPIALLALQLVLANGLWKRLARVRRRRMGIPVVIVLASCFIASHLVHIWADATGYRPIVAQDDIFPLHYPATARGFIARQGLMEEGEMAVPNRIAPSSHQLLYPLTDINCVPPTTQDVLMITIDGFRADMVNQQTMPYLMDLSQQSHWFEHHSSASNSYNHGLFTMFYSMLPSYREPLLLDLKGPELTKQLHRAGYHLSAYGINQAATPFDKQTWLQDFNVVPTPVDDVAAEQDIAISQQVISHIEQKNGPQFNLVSLSAPAYYSTPVGEVGIPTVRADKSLNHAQQVLFNQYRQSLHFIDGQLQRLVEAAGENTVVIITGTHGHLFTTDINADSRANFSPAATRVPLLIRWNGQRPRAISHRTSHYGVVPTLMTNLLQCTTPIREYSLGEELYQPPHNDYLVIGNARQFAIQTERAITVIDNRGAYRVYNNNYKRQREAKLDVPVLVLMMEEGGRFRSH
ncbi:DUF3413 domain-containing protein [Ferrimonas lipolytica]|uniref:DUF3413 domain-containing protein n=1 Tax=Ferrimonas lipolytica TaxID=2724191 RepID=A0A6H1UAU3_9GAMM|nr:DUF3413 domain-containing protein [Ferrimonas lipolytica]QIZ76171.1 DUF3413 domain-containing protein [Ferrimonas lipolytica]